MSEARLGYMPAHLPDAQRRVRLREQGYRDGYRSAPKMSTEPEYLTSYRRGREQKESEK